MSIKKDSVVSMHYELKDANSGEILEASQENSPLSFIVGRGQIVEKMENEICKMNLGDKSDIFFKSEELYGEYNEKALQILPKEQFAGIELKKGMILFGQAEDGSSSQVIVKDFDEENVTIDFNHPYAGKDLMFGISLLDIRDATEDELATGVVNGGRGCCGGHHHEHRDECCGGSGDGCCGH